MGIDRIKTEKTEEFSRRLSLFTAVPVLFFIFFLIVLFSLQIIKGPDYERRARTNREQFSIMPAIRGVISDINRETTLAYNKRSFAVTIVPQNLPGDGAEICSPPKAASGTVCKISS